MGRFYADAQGDILRFVPVRLEQRYGAPPGSELELALDERTNRARVEHYLANKAEYTLDAGPPVRLLRNGQPVTLNGPGSLAAIRAKVFAGLPLNDAERNVLDRLFFRLLADARDE